MVSQSVQTPAWRALLQDRYGSGTSLRSSQMQQTPVQSAVTDRYNSDSLQEAELRQSREAQQEQQQLQQQQQQRDLEQVSLKTLCVRKSALR